jgi:hypothetical protein
MKPFVKNKQNKSQNTKKNWIFISNYGTWTNFKKRTWYVKPCRMLIYKSTFLF